jgi:hypothetical protein
MRYKNILLISIFIIMSLSSCQKNSPWSISGKGNNITETREPGSFSAIHLSIDADVYYTQDSIYKVEVSGQGNILNVLETKVHGDKLDIGFGQPVWMHKEIKIYIHSPNITGLTLSGSGNIIAENNLKSTSMYLKISGSGKIKIPSLITGRIDVKISGSGDINVSGGATSTETINISGSGNVDMLNLLANSCEGKISGSGDILVNLTQSLDATISGSGNIKYKGTAIVNTHISGSGNVIHLN